MSSSVSHSVVVKRAEFEDVSMLNDAVADNGGLATYKATFGAFNLTTVIENSYIMLTANLVSQSEDQPDKSVGIISVNDCVSQTATDNAFTPTINALKAYIPVTVIRD
jgi:hypothetical protein